MRVAAGQCAMSHEARRQGSGRIRDAIDLAEDFVDPLEGLTEKTAQDPGAPFTVNMLEQLRALKIQDLARFESLRAQLKKQGCSVTRLDAAIAHKSDQGRREPKQADILLELAAPVELFRGPQGKAYADIAVRGHRETWPVRSRHLRHWLTREFLNRIGGVPSSEALHSVLNALEAKAHIEGQEKPVYIRVGGTDGRIYLDLCDEAWRAVEITPSGWKVIDNPPVRFCRPAGMKPLPVPLPGGSVTTLRYYLNLRSDADFVLVVAWALAVIRDRGPYPVLVLSGEHGSAKSSFTAILRELLDPRTPPFRSFPREDRDIFIAANGSHLLAFDNISSIPPWISDTLCRLATGGGFAVRQLYTDLDEILFDATRPLILNGIEDNVTRPDLADRAIMLNLEAIADEHRRPESALWRDFKADMPSILGALLDAVAEGLRRLPGITVEGLPRMADFALWATACETSTWAPGTFMAAYQGNLHKTIDDVIERDQVGAAVYGMMTQRPDQTVWTGTAADLLLILTKNAGDIVSDSKYWPKTPRGLSNRLRRVEPVLRKVGIEIERDRDRGKTRARLIEITAKGFWAHPNREGRHPSAPSVTSTSSDSPIYENKIHGFEGTTRRTIEGVEDGNADAGKSQTGSAIRSEYLTRSDTSITPDVTDAECAAQSAPNANGHPGWRATI